MAVMPLMGAAHLEVHVAEEILEPLDIHHGHEPVASVTRPQEMPATGALIGTPASIRARVEPQIDAWEVEPLEESTSLTSRMV